MNAVGKVLVVFVTVSSLAFLAFVIALRNGGPDWEGEMNSPELLKEFVFTSEPGEKVTYSAKHRRSDTAVGQKSPVLATVVLAARKRLEEDASKKFQELSPIPQQKADLLKMITELIPVDQKGVEQHEQIFAERIKTLWDAIQADAAKFSTLTLETQDVLKVGQERREEEYRLANQLELLRTDKFAAQQQQKVLEDELTRLEENKRRLGRRQVQLKQQLGDDYERVEQ